MTSRNRPRGRGDSRGPRASSSATVYAAAADRYGAVAAMLPRRQRTNAYMVAAQVLDRLAESVEERVAAGQRRHGIEE
jgi:hypothetical protein